MEVFETVRGQLPQFSLITEDNMAALNDHAERMYQLLPCQNAATFIFIEDNVRVALCIPRVMCVLGSHFVSTLGLLCWQSHTPYNWHDMWFYNT